MLFKIGLTIFTKHPYHLIDPSPWPLITSSAVFIVTIGLVGWMHHVIGGWSLFLNVTVLLLFITAIWWRDTIREATFCKSKNDYKLLERAFASSNYFSVGGPDDGALFTIVMGVVVAVIITGGYWVTKALFYKDVSSVPAPEFDPNTYAALTEELMPQTVPDFDLDQYLARFEALRKTLDPTQRKILYEMMDKQAVVDRYKDPLWEEWVTSTIQEQQKALASASDLTFNWELATRDMIHWAMDFERVAYEAFDFWIKEFGPDVLGQILSIAATDVNWLVFLPIFFSPLFGKLPIKIYINFVKAFCVKGGFLRLLKEVKRLLIQSQICSTPLFLLKKYILTSSGYQFLKVIVRKWIGQ